jgi:prolyl oligopeptidase
MHDVTARVRVHGLEGAFEHDLALPGPGTVDGFIGERGAVSAFFTFTSFLQPTTVYRYDIASRATAVFCGSALPGFDSSSFETRQVFVESKDGRACRCSSSIARAAPTARTRC